MNRTIVKNIGVVAGSIALSLIAIVLGSKFYAKWLNIHDPSFRYENRLKMWRLEPTIGFVNKHNFVSYCWGNVLAQTNERGFRGSRPTQVLKENGERRIIGIGDSVIWGTGVNQKDSFLGVLEKKLNEDSFYEVINAGVVGYSTYQEYLFLKKYILPLKPEVVIVNYCSNDFLPTENPFNNARRIYSRYLNYLLNSQDVVLTTEKKEMVGDLVRIFDSAKHVWDEIEKWDKKAPNRRHLMLEVLVEIPIIWMAELCRQSDIRLIYVFIPPKWSGDWFKRDVKHLKKILIEQNAEFVDVQSALLEKKKELAHKIRKRFVRFKWLWPPELKQVLRARYIQMVHRNYKFIDNSHPSKRGNTIIAEHIYQYLKETSNNIRRRGDNSTTASLKWYSYSGHFEKPITITSFKEVSLDPKTKGLLKTIEAPCSLLQGMRSLFQFKVDAIKLITE